MKQCKRKAEVYPGISQQEWADLYSGILNSKYYHLIEDVAPEVLVYTAATPYEGAGTYKWFCENCCHEDFDDKVWISDIAYKNEEVAFIDAIHHIEEHHPEHFFNGLYDD